MSHYDILIVGGGLVGGSLACALGQLPLKIGLIEAQPASLKIQDDFDARSIAIAYGSQRILSSIGLWDDLAPHAESIQHIHISNRGHFGLSHLQAAKEKVAALGYLVEVNYINKAIQSRLQNCSSLDIICPAKVCRANIQQCAELEIETAQGSQSLTADLLVAADGAASTIRQQLNISSVQHDYGVSAIVGNIGLARDHHNVAYERFCEPGPIALLPLLHKRAALVWTVQRDRVDEYMQMPQAEFLERLQTEFGYRCGRFIKMGRRGAFPLKLIYAEQTITKNTVIIGNAAHNLHPIAGQGLNLGLRDVAVLYDKIIAVLKDKKSLRDFSILEDYQAARQSDQKSIMQITDGLARLFANPFAPIQLARNCGLLALELSSFLKHNVSERMMGLHGRVPKLMCGISNESETI